MMFPVGPVVVFAASNFPFAFSVAGGDTAAALAAGCPVVLKAHPGHPALSRRTAMVVEGALTSSGAPHGTFSVIYGDDAGRSAVVSEHIRAGAFTGSLGAGRALFDLAASRPTPIPFYAGDGQPQSGLCHPNRHGQSDERTSSRGSPPSFTLSAGQFCTKPGLLFVPSGAVSDEVFVDALAAHRSAVPLLNAVSIEAMPRGSWPCETIPPSAPLPPMTRRREEPTPTLLATTVPELLDARDALLVECFGPTSLVVEYATDEELLAAAEAFGGQLAAGVHGEETDPILPALLALLADRAGRVLWNSWPTGVSVTEAMQHGGPYPATTAPLHTSVGPAAVERFLRPVCFQSMPDHLLPLALRDDNPLGIPRRINGQREVL